MAKGARSVRWPRSGGTRHARRRNDSGHHSFEVSPTGEPDDRKRSSPVRRGAAETEPYSHRADRLPYQKTGDPPNRFRVDASLVELIRGGRVSVSQESPACGPLVRL